MKHCTVRSAQYRFDHIANESFENESYVAHQYFPIFRLGLEFYWVLPCCYETNIVCRELVCLGVTCLIVNTMSGINTLNSAYSNLPPCSDCSVALQLVGR